MRRDAVTSADALASFRSRNKNKRHPFPLVIADAVGRICRLSRQPRLQYASNFSGGYFMTRSDWAIAAFGFAAGVAFVFLVALAAGSAAIWALLQAIQILFIEGY
jgi:hypothetical protein